MSTTFEVYPTTETIPSYRELLDVATAHLGNFPRSYNIMQAVPLNVILRGAEPCSVIQLKLDDAALWLDGCFAWFHVPGIAGGTYAFARSMDDHGRGNLEDIASRHLPQFPEAIIDGARVRGRYWSFGRSGGQPAIINIAYGMLAGTLARLTGGFVHSEDGAWDYHRLPAWPDTFLANYFRPELNREWENYQWAKDCIERLPEQLKQVRSE